MVPVTLTTFGLHAGKIKFNTQNEKQIIIQDTVSKK